MAREQQKIYSEILDHLCQKQLLIDRKQLDSMLRLPIIDRSLGCIFGAFIGDSLGSYCQFQGFQQPKKMDFIMQMPGGGTFNLQPGQITDDSQMALHLLEGLLKYQPNIPLKQQIQFLQFSIALQYIKWLSSQPFDIGITCQQAILCFESHLNNHKNIQNFQQFRKHKEQISMKLNRALAQINSLNNYSLSNGFLMRIPTMVCFYSIISHLKLDQSKYLPLLVENEARLTHSHEIAIDSCLQWVSMLSQIIHRPQKNPKDDLIQLNRIFNKFLFHSNHVTKIRKEILQQISSKQSIDATQKMGFFKHSYRFSIYDMKSIQLMLKEDGQLGAEQKRYKHDFIQNPSKYFQDSLRFVISQGGDSDTNACIVGGFLGSIIGFRNLPKLYLNKQLRLKLNPITRAGLAQKYQPKNGLINFIKLFKRLKK